MSNRGLIGLASFALVVGAAGDAAAQIAITTDTTAIDFAAYTGAGLAPTPAAGQLDSDDWMVTGMSDGATTFGGTHAAGDFARGQSAISVSTGGLYAFAVADGDAAFGWQAGGTDFTPGTAVVRFVNATSVTLSDPTISYEVWARNDQERASSVTLAHSPDGASPIAVPAAAFVSPEASDALGWVMTPRSATLAGVTIAPGGTLYLVFGSDDVSGAGNRDELAIDDLVVTFPTCGTGALEPWEGCDDGDLDDGDGCSATCQEEPGWACTSAPSTCVTTCGDGVVAGAEVCDDGDTDAGDGCDGACAPESGWTCPPAGGVCAAVCGDGALVGDEDCDDGDTDAGDGCDAACGQEAGWACAGAPSVCTTSCGDGVVAGAEACDDGDSDAGDGCDAACAEEPGFTCAGSPSVCSSTCGDGVIASDEGCDDAGEAAGDGCDAACAVEAGWTCTGEPSSCTEDTLCGNGALDGGEQCDDGARDDGDGCSAACVVEGGFACDGEPSVCAPDGDRDGVVDELDNCPTVSNPGQADGDGDGVGNACDIDDGDDDPASGGGCCAASGGDPSGLALLGLAVLAVVGRRRRGRRRG